MTVVLYRDEQGALFRLFQFVGFLFTCIIMVGKEEHRLTGLLEMEKHNTREEV